MKAINQSLIIYDPFSCFFFFSNLKEKDQSKRLAWGHTYTKMQTLGTTCILTKPQKPNAALSATPGKPEEFQSV